MLASPGSIGKNRNSLTCLRNAGSYFAMTYCAVCRMLNEITESPSESSVRLPSDLLNDSVRLRISIKTSHNQKGFLAGFVSVLLARSVVDSCTVPVISRSALYSTCYLWRGESRKSLIPLTTMRLPSDMPNDSVRFRVSRNDPRGDQLQSARGMIKSSVHSHIATPLVPKA